MLSKESLEWIEEFHLSTTGLDPVTTVMAQCHDLIHAVTGLGVSLEDEEIVLNIQNVLGGEGCLEHNAARVEFFISIMPAGVIEDLVNTLAEIN